MTHVQPMHRILILLAALSAVHTRAADCASKEPTGSRGQRAESSAQLGPGNLSFAGSLRLRSESFDSFNILGYDTGHDDLGLYERLRLELDYRLDGGPRLHVMLQDSRFWQDDLSRDDFGASCPYENPLDLRNLYVESEQIGGTPWGFRIGRQAISYADKHVFGPGDWGNVGRYAWDAAKLVHDTRYLRIEAFFAQRVLFETDGLDDRHHDYDVWAVYAQLEGLARSAEQEGPLELHLFSVLKRDHAGPSGERRVTLGAYAGFKDLGRWDGRGTLAVQRGDVGGDDIRALGYSARLGYTVRLKWPLRIGAEHAYASGDSDPHDNRNETFDNVFGSVDAYYGHMNLFAWKNLRDSQLSIGVRPHSSLQVSLDHHWFQLAEAEDSWYYGSGKPQRRDPAGASSRDLGREVDLRATWQVSEDLEVLAGYSWFDPGSFMRHTADHEQERAEWAFLQLTWSL